MSDNKVKGKQASSRLLGMKFMQRSMEKELQEEHEKERKRVISEAEWTVDYDTGELQKPAIRVEYQPSFLAFSTTTTTGRKSFKGFNKDIEEGEVDIEKTERLKREEAAEEAHSMSDKQMLNSKTTIRSFMRPPKRKDTSKESAESDNVDGEKKKKKKKAKLENQGFIRPK